MLIRTFVAKIINNDRKLLTDHEIIDRTAEQIESVITQVCEESFGFIRANGSQFSHLLSFI